jgi:thiamine-monophosphate kinase
MIDVSDGLGSDLLQIARQSQLAAEIEVDQLPLPDRKIGEIDPLDAALNGGEDYALLFATSEKQLDRLNSEYRTDFPPYRVIGHLYSGEPGLYLKRGKKRERYEPRGFDHFSSC